MYNFTLKQLVYFTTVSKKGSLKYAAEELNISQPSISKAISILENNMGTSLFIRHHAQGISLTPAGKHILQYAEELLSKVDEFDVIAKKDSNNLPIKIGCYSPFAPRIIPKLITSYNKKYPNKIVNVYEGTQEDLTKKVLTGELDIIIVYNFLLNNDLYTKKIATLQPKALLSINNPLAKNKTISLKELSKYPFIMLNRSVSKQYFERILAKTNFEFNVVYKARNIEMIRGLVGEEFGVSLLTSHTEASRTYRGKKVVSVPLDEEVEPSSIHLAHALGSSMHSSGRDFIDFCLENKEMFY